LGSFLSSEAGPSGPVFLVSDTIRNLKLVKGKVDHVCMAIDLADLVDNLKIEVNPPGQTVFAEATDADYELYLSNSFWELTLRGYITGYTANETVVSPESGTDELSRELQQLVVINGAMAIMRVHLANIDTGFRAHAGAAEFETRKSAQAIQAVLENLQDRYQTILDHLPSENEGHPTFYNDIMNLRGFYGGVFDDPYFSGY